MITLDSNYSLILKLGEATNTTECDYIVTYSSAVLKREAGTATKVPAVEVATGQTNGNTNVTALAAPTTGTGDRYEVDTFSLVNRDTVVHTVSVSLKTGSTERRRCNAVSVPVSGTLLIDTFGAITVTAAAAETDNRSQKLAGILTSSASNTLFTAARNYAAVLVILTTDSGITTSTNVIVYHRPLGATKAGTQIIFNGAVNAGENVPLPLLGLLSTDVLTVDVDSTSRVVASVYGVAR